MPRKRKQAVPDRGPDAPAPGDADLYFVPLTRAQICALHQVNPNAVALFGLLGTYRMRPEMEAQGKAAWVGQEQLAAHLVVSLSTIHRTAKAMAAAGFIAIDRPRRNGPYRYRLGSQAVAMGRPETATADLSKMTGRNAPRPVKDDESRLVRDDGSGGGSDLSKMTAPLEIRGSNTTPLEALEAVRSGPGSRGNRAGRSGPAAAATPDGPRAA